MLYKLNFSDGIQSSLKPLPFLDFGQLGKIEKDLEQLLSENLLEVLYEDAILFPFFQERPLQAEADIYAINKNGDLVIFELKRGLAGSDAMLQALRYSQNSGSWMYSHLNKLFNKYLSERKLPTAELSTAHKEAFSLDVALKPEMFNRKQHLIIVGNAANNHLIDAVDYWKRNGLKVDFVPYRVYKIQNEVYFEFFALPYDRHQNPANVKGVLFDTNKSYNEDSVWEMLENKRVAAYGTTKRVIDYLNQKDIVFLSHKNVGIVAAGEIISKRKIIEECNEYYRDIRFLTPLPKNKNRLIGLPFSNVSEITGKNFFWAKTIKVPYLSKDESDQLLIALTDFLKSNS